MPDTPPRRQSQPITLQQKQTLIAVYQQSGNMSLAMREAGIQSPRTAYLWWRRFCVEGEAGLQPRSHARHTQKRLSNEIVEQVCELRWQEPGWGRRQIASALAKRYGHPVISPSAVEAALRRGGLWGETPQRSASAPRSENTPDWLGKRIDYDRLLATMQSAIHLATQSDALAANKLLYQQVWRPLEADRALWNRLLATTEAGLGSWLLASRLILGHSLMNSGRWTLSERILRETIVWMGEHPVGLRQRDTDGGPHLVSLRRDDVWLGCYHHLGLVLGKRQIDIGIGFLQTALGAIARHHRPVIPTDSAEAGNLERDLAHLKLRVGRVPVAEIQQHLRRAQQSAEEAGSSAAQAFTYLAWAKLHDRLARGTGVREQSARQRQRDEMELAIQRALATIETEQEDRPMRLTLCYVDAAELCRAHTMPIEGRWVQSAAEYCIQYGYGGQAQHLLAIPGIQAWLSEETLRDLARIARRDDQN